MTASIARHIFAGVTGIGPSSIVWKRADPAMYHYAGNNPLQPGRGYCPLVTGPNPKMFE